LLDIGSGDDVRVNDIYEARDLAKADLPIGRVRITQVFDMRSRAKIISEDVGVTLGGEHEFVLSQKEPLFPHVRVGMVAIGDERSRGAIHEPREATLVAAALHEAKTLARNLELSVHSLEVEQLEADEDMLKRIAQLARAQRLDQIVWISDKCKQPPCTRVWHSVITDDPDQPLMPEPLLLPSTIGGAPSADAQITLGQISYAAGAYDEASYHLRAWAATDDKAPHVPEALIQLAEAEYAVGQLDRSRMWLAKARVPSSRVDLHGQFFEALTRNACADGTTAELARLKYHISQRIAHTPRLKHVKLDVIGCEVDINLQRGERTTANTLIDEGLTLSRELGDQNQTVKLEGLRAKVLQQTGQLDAAHAHLRKAFDTMLELQNLAAQAKLSLELAKNRILAGDLPVADEYARYALTIFKGRKDEAGIVESMPVLVQIVRRLRGAEQARHFFEIERRQLQRRQLPRADLALQLAQSYLSLEQGNMARASKQLETLLDRARKYHLMDEETQILGLLAEAYLISGKTKEAYKTIDVYWSRAQKFHRNSDIARARLLYANLRLLEGNGKMARDSAVNAVSDYSKIGDRAGEAMSTYVLGEVEREFGDPSHARQHYDRAKALFEQIFDTEGQHMATLGIVALGLWREGAPSARSEIPAIIDYYEKTGNTIAALRASLLLEWANFLHVRDRIATLQSLRAMREKAKRGGYAALQAEAQMLIACVHRVDSDHKAAKSEFQTAESLYAEIGRHTQTWKCATSGEVMPLAAPAGRDDAQ
jgi:hypothetical protein